jgi:hypothetical protein
MIDLIDNLLKTTGGLCLSSPGFPFPPVSVGLVRGVLLSLAATFNPVLITPSITC